MSKASKNEISATNQFGEGTQSTLTCKMDKYNGFVSPPTHNLCTDLHLGVKNVPPKTAQ